MKACASQSQQRHTSKHHYERYHPPTLHKKALGYVVRALLCFLLLYRSLLLCKNQLQCSLLLSLRNAIKVRPLSVKLPKICMPFSFHSTEFNHSESRDCICVRVASEHLSPTVSTQEDDVENMTVDAHNVGARG